MRGRTTLVIDHSLSTIRATDQVLVLGGGRVAEHGRCDELLARKRAFVRLADVQGVPA